MKASETAVVFVEFQNEFCKEDGKLYDLVKESLTTTSALENAKRLMNGAREKGCLVVHCPFVLDADWVQEKSICGLIGNLGQGKIFASGDWGTKIIDELAPAANEPIVKGKRSISGFAYTNLETILREKKIKNVVVCGFLTNICVQATAWRSYDLGFKTRIITEASVATTVANQNYVETQICPMLGGTLSVDEFLESVKCI